MSCLKWVFAPKEEVVRSLIVDYIDAHIPLSDDDKERREIIRKVRLWNDVYPRLGLLRLYETRTRTKVDPNKGLIKSKEDTKKVQESLPYPSFENNILSPLNVGPLWRLDDFPSIAYLLIYNWATKQHGNWGFSTLKEEIIGPLIYTIRFDHGPSTKPESMWMAMSHLAEELGITDLSQYAGSPLGPLTPSGKVMYPILVSHEYAESRDLG